MRDDSRKWTSPESVPAPLDLGGATLRVAILQRQTLISGISVRVNSPLPLIGWPDVAKGEAYRITLRRDRIVEVGGTARPEGWNAERAEAASDITDGWGVLDLEGPRALDILKRGTEISLSEPSASVVRKLWGLDVWLYRFETEDRFRLHIARAMEEALIGNIKAAGALMES